MKMIGEEFVDYIGRIICYSFVLNEIDNSNFRS